MGSTDGMTLRAVDLHRQTIQPPIAALATTGNFIVGRILLALMGARRAPLVGILNRVFRSFYQGLSPCCAIRDGCKL